MVRGGQGLVSITKIALSISISFLAQTSLHFLSTLQAAQLAEFLGQSDLVWRWWSEVGKG